MHKDEDSLFGSYFIIWSNGSDMIRFTWNGKEGACYVEASNQLPFTSESVWRTIYSVAVNEFKLASDHYLLAITEELINNLGKSGLIT